MRNCTTIQLSMVGAVPPTGERAADFHPLLAFWDGAPGGGVRAPLCGGFGRCRQATAAALRPTLHIRG